MRDVYEEMLEAWGQPRVRQSDLRKFSFGTFTGKRLSNLRALGEEVPCAVKVGKHNLYDSRELADFLRRRYSQKNNAA